MADVTYTENLPKDASSQSFLGGVADLGAANEMDGIAGVNRRTQNGKPVVDLSTDVSTTSGAGHRLDEALPASLGHKAASASFPVVATERQFTSKIARIPGDGHTHYLGYAAAGTRNPSHDTMLNALSAKTGYNYGTSATLQIGAVGTSASPARRVLMWFSVQDFALTTIATATLRLKSSTAPIVGGTLQAYAIKIENHFVEGAKDDAAADGTDPSWAKKSQTPSETWAGSAGLSTSGTDYDAASLGTLTWDTAVGGTWYEMAMDAELVQGNTDYSYGWLLKADDETTEDAFLSFLSSEDGTAGNRPQLVLTLSATQKVPTRVFLMADTAGATWSNSTSVSTTDAPIPTGGIEVPAVSNDGTPGVSVYVPLGVNVWYAGIGNG
jgi:hypothetical protein